MSILSNYVNCLVRAEVSSIADLQEKHIDNPLDFAQRFVQSRSNCRVEPLEL
jgi:hydroxymethylglutaryl-CoA reductase